MKGPVFLALVEVLALHADQIERYGGAAGVRDTGLLESALGVPRATFAGGFLHGRSAGPAPHGRALGTARVTRS